MGSCHPCEVLDWVLMSSPCRHLSSESVDESLSLHVFQAGEKWDLHLLVHSPDSQSSQGWAKAKSRHSALISPMDGRDPTTQMCIFRNWKTRGQSCDLISGIRFGCWFKSQLFHFPSNSLLMAWWSLGTWTQVGELKEFLAIWGVNWQMKDLYPSPLMLLSLYFFLSNKLR